MTTMNLPRQGGTVYLSKHQIDVRLFVLVWLRCATRNMLRGGGRIIDGAGTKKQILILALKQKSLNVNTAFVGVVGNYHMTLNYLIYVLSVRNSINENVSIRLQK